MADSSNNFDAILADYDVALTTLAEVLQYIETNKPNARLRVVLLNNTIVTLTATVEEILRGLFQEYLSILENNFVDYRKLRKDLQKSNLECTIQALRKSVDLKDATVMVTSLSTCMNGLLGYRLLKERLVYNQGNFRSTQVTEIAKSFGISCLWRKICDSSEIEDYIGEAALDMRETRLLAKWNEVFEERDLVVHRVSQANGWAPERINESIRLSRLVVKRISVCLLKDANELMEAKDGSCAS